MYVCMHVCNHDLRATFHSGPMIDEETKWLMKFRFDVDGANSNRQDTRTGRPASNVC